MEEEWESILRTKSVRRLNKITQKKNCVFLNYGDNWIQASKSDIYYLLLYINQIHINLYNGETEPIVCSLANDIERKIFKILGVQDDDVVCLKEEFFEIFLSFRTAKT